MRGFIIKCANLLLVIGLLAGYSVEAQRLKTDQESKAAQAAQGQGTFAEDGTYEGSGQGFGGKIKVRLTVKDKKLVKAEILSAPKETKEYLDSAKAMLDSAVKQQSIEVDTVSGATLSSNGILEAMKQAMKK